MSTAEEGPYVYIGVFDEGRQLSSERDYWQRLADRFGRALVAIGHHAIGTHQHPDAYDAESHYACELEECIDATIAHIQWRLSSAPEHKYRWGSGECDGQSIADPLRLCGCSRPQRDPARPDWCICGHVLEASR